MNHTLSRVLAEQRLVDVMRSAERERPLQALRRERPSPRRLLDRACQRLLRAALPSGSKPVPQRRP